MTNDGLDALVRRLQFVCGRPAIVDGATVVALVHGRTKRWPTGKTFPEQGATIAAGPTDRGGGSDFTGRMFD